MNWILENWTMILEIVGAASALAAIFAKLTKNKTDDKIVAAVQKLLDFAAINPIRAAEEAGDDAVAKDPAGGLDDITGPPRDVN